MTLWKKIDENLTVEKYLADSDGVLECLLSPHDFRHFLCQLSLQSLLSWVRFIFFDHRFDFVQRAQAKVCLIL